MEERVDSKIKVLSNYQALFSLESDEICLSAMLLIELLSLFTLPI